MKKSKILIPALAVLAFSTVASVTGTVAWFTSQSSVQISTTKFQITGLEGSLDVTPTAGAGTAVSGTGKNTVITAGIANEKTNTLTHGSFDIKSKNVYSVNQITHAYTNKSGAHLGKGMVANDFMENPVTQQYNAFSWSLTFKYGDGTAYTQPKPLNLYFDINTAVSYATPATALTADEANASRAFRVAIIEDLGLDGDGNQQWGKAMVWSPLQFQHMGKGSADVSTDKVSCHVGVTDQSAGTLGEVPYDYSNNGELTYRAQTDLTSLADAGEAGKARTDYLAQFNTTNKGVINLVFVAWFEGCDEVNVASDVSIRPNVETKMSFFIREDNTPAA